MATSSSDVSIRLSAGGKAGGMSWFWWIFHGMLNFIAPVLPVDLLVLRELVRYVESDIVSGQGLMFHSNGIDLVKFVPRFARVVPLSSRHQGVGCGECEGWSS